MDLLWDVAVKTALVLVLLYGVLWVIRRYYGKPGVSRRGTSLLVVQSAQLGPGRSVHLIGVGGRLLLVGATSQQVSLLVEVEATETEMEAEPITDGESFDRYLRQAVDAAGSISSRLREIRLGRGTDGESGRGKLE